MSFVIAYAGPSDWTLLDEMKHIWAFYGLIGYPDETPLSGMDAAVIADVSPIALVDSKDSPLLLVHGDADLIVPVQHTLKLASALQSVGVAVQTHMVLGGNHEVCNAMDPVVIELSNRFIKTHLLTQD